MKDKSIIERGERANRMLLNEDFIGMMKDMREETFGKFARSEFLNEDAIKELHLEARALFLMERRVKTDVASAKYENEKHNELDQG